MDQEALEILKEAIETRLRSESVERSIGRTVRRRGLDFSIYIGMMNDIRDFAGPRKLSLDDAAETLLDEEYQDRE
ncbi:MAG: hypothetical protein IH630_01805 [Thermoplasmata archaeon]|nr:hypothetical protein [Thermoplasmata archaeon]MCJ7561501.1 hypothetical protein [Thermoplasmata archaeon]TFG69672.1 MAG: hypothetical protein E4H25_04315 [Methanomassiliicoccus sp.]